MKLLQALLGVVCILTGAANIAEHHRYVMAAFEMAGGLCWLLRSMRPYPRPDASATPGPTRERT